MRGGFAAVPKHFAGDLPDSGEGGRQRPNGESTGARAKAFTGHRFLLALGTRGRSENVADLRIHLAQFTQCAFEQHGALFILHCRFAAEDCPLLAGELGEVGSIKRTALGKRACNHRQHFRRYLVGSHVDGARAVVFVQRDSGQVAAFDGCNTGAPDKGFVLQQRVDRSRQCFGGFRVHLAGRDVAPQHGEVLLVVGIIAVGIVQREVVLHDARIEVGVLFGGKQSL